MSAEDFWTSSAITVVNRTAFGARMAAFNPTPTGAYRWDRAGDVTKLRPVPGPLDAVLRSRTSIRSFGPEPVTGDDLGAVLGALAERADGHRSYPAAGALYAIGVVAWLFHVDHPLNGHTTQYLPALHALADLGKAPNWAEESVDFTGDSGSLPPPIVVGLFAHLDQVHSKYGDRGDRFALIEAGEVLQLLSLAVAARGLAGYAIGASNDTRMVALAGLDRLGARFIVGYALGKPA